MQALGWHPVNATAACAPQPQPQPKRYGPARWCPDRGCSMIAKAVPTADLVEEIDLVEYWAPAGPSALQQPGRPDKSVVRLGRVIKVVGSRGIVMEPLVEEEEGVFVAEEAAQPETVDPGAVVRIIQYELSQRQDKVSNPHGEHAHDIFRILEPLSQGLWKGTGHT